MTDIERAGRLRAETARAKHRLAELELERAGVIAAAQDANLDDEHDVEGPSVAFERQRLANLAAQARNALDRLEEASRRVGSEKDGCCGTCGSAIGAERLTALPAASRCIACAKGLEGRRPLEERERSSPTRSGPSPTSSG